MIAIERHEDQHRLLISEQLFIEKLGFLPLLLFNPKSANIEYCYLDTASIEGLEYSYWPITTYFVYAQARLRP